MLYFGSSTLKHGILYNKELTENHICSIGGGNDLNFYAIVYRIGGNYGKRKFNCSREFKTYQNQ